MRRPGAARGVVPLLALLLLASAGLWAAGLARAAPLPHPLPWWAVAVAFCASELFVVHIQVKREAQAVALSEVPLTVGLFLAAPTVVVAGWVVAVLLVCSLYRRLPAVKVAFNAALVALQASLAITLFRLLAGPPTLGPRAGLAALLATVLPSALSALLISAVIALHEGPPGARQLLGETASAAAQALVVTIFGLVAVCALVASRLAAWPLAAAAAAMLAGYRAYAILSERHLGLERLYRFSQAVGSTPEMDGVLRSVLEQARELLHAEHAEIAFLQGGPSRAGVRVTLGHGGRLGREEVADLDDGDGLWRRVERGGGAILLPQGTRDADLRAWLAARGAREAVLVPLRGEAGVTGMITVTDRMGTVRTFDAGDVRLLETVANHAGVALRHGRLVDRLRHDALHDGLTGLLNREALQRQLREGLAALPPQGGPGLAVMIMDLDGFKEVNDTLGHQHGDLLLREVATRLEGAAGPRATVARLGGDEFALLVQEVAGDAEALALARAMLRALEEPVVLGGVGVQVGASIGVALAPLHARDAPALLKRADIAMYNAKGSAGGLALYDPRRDTTSPQRLALVGELRQAVQLDQLEIHVQPKAALATGEVTGVEALVRWQHPRHGMLPPDEFVPVAERSGLIGPLTELVLRHALAAAAAWRAQGLELGIAVNLSARSLLDPCLADLVARLLGRYGVPGGLLTLELTESSIMTDPSRTIRLLDRLAALGVHLSVDDFGTGYSSLSYLKRLPVNEVKIDKSFVTDLERDPDSAIIVRSIVDLAANLSLDTVAEGVEDEATWRRLAAMGCTMAQGWQLGRPMPAGELPGWLAARHGASGAAPSTTAGALVASRHPA